MKTIFEMRFLSVNRVDIWCAETDDFIWKNYSTKEAPIITKRAELIGKKKFTKTALDKNVKIFIVHVAALLTLSIYLSWEIQLGLLLVVALLTLLIYPNREIQLGLLLVDEAVTEAAPQYSDYTNLFSYDLVME